MSRHAKKPRAGLIGAVILVAVAAGGTALYVTGGVSGNTSADTASAETTAATAADCAASTERAQRLGKSATGAVAAMLAADPPVSLASLSFDGPDGKPLTIADFSGRTVLLNLWATWCAPCRAEMPALDALEKTLGADDFEVVAVNVDTGDKAKPEKFLADTGVEALAHYRDNTLALFNDLKKRGLALGLPVTLLIGEDGCLLTHMNGPAAWDSPDAEEWVKAAIDGEV